MWEGDNIAKENFTVEYNWILNFLIGEKLNTTDTLGWCNLGSAENIAVECCIFWTFIVKYMREYIFLNENWYF